MANAKWERYILIGVVFGIAAFASTQGGVQFMPLAWLFGVVSAIFIIVAVLIITKFLKKTPF